MHPRFASLGLTARLNLNLTLSPSVSHRNEGGAGVGQERRDQRGPVCFKDFCGTEVLSRTNGLPELKGLITCAGGSLPGYAAAASRLAVLPLSFIRMNCIHLANHDGTAMMIAREWQISKSDQNLANQICDCRVII